jgi:Ca2+-binding EF-hand superfamily protein
MENFTGVKVDELAVREAMRMGDGAIDFETFVRIFGIDTGSSDTAFDDRVEIAFRAFQQIDSEEKGEVGPADLNRGLQLMGIEVGVDEMQRMFDEVDEDGSGMVVI